MIIKKKKKSNYKIKVTEIAKYSLEYHGTLEKH
jgi:hypothetical protein